MGSCCCPPAEKEKVQSNNKSKKTSKNKSRKKTTKAEKSKSSSKAPATSKACQLSKGVVDPPAKGAIVKVKVKTESGKSGVEVKVAAAPRSSSAGASKLAQCGPLGASSSSTVNLSKYSFTASSVHSRSSDANSQALSGVSATATGTKGAETPKSRTTSNPKTVVFSKALSTVSESLSKTFESKAVK